MKKAIIFVFPLVFGIIGGFLALHFFSFNYIQKYLISDDRLDLIPVEVTEVREIHIRENEAIIEEIKKVERAVIGVKTITRSGFIEGSGLIVSSDGLLVVLNQLVPVGGNFEFYINGDTMPYEVIKRDTDIGLALISVEGTNLPTLEFRNLDNLNIGEPAFLVGSFFNDSDEIIKSVNHGIIKRFDDYIRTNIFEEKSLLGSVLFDIEGRVLGINLIDQRGEIYSIPISEIREFSGF